jgi:hypothetical protein
LHLFSVFLLDIRVSIQKRVQSVVLELVLIDLKIFYTENCPFKVQKDVIYILNRDGAEVFIITEDIGLNVHLRLNGNSEIGGIFQIAELRRIDAFE